jgi:aspartyl-tRNA(Asn)/glutamyl-tRNA(Gln) amidotransferase subunit B
MLISIRRPSSGAFTMSTSYARKHLAVVPIRRYICQSCLRRAGTTPLTPTWLSNSPTVRALHADSKARPSDDAPFRKLLKDAAKKRKREQRAGLQSSKGSQTDQDARRDKWELTIGIEIHAELNTARKLFSHATTSVNEEPNSHVALFDVAFPGSQPHFQRETLVPALRAALALNCDIQRRSSFDRKHYFYQDQPAGYQITQYYGETLRASDTASGC